MIKISTLEFFEIIQLEASALESLLTSEIFNSNISNTKAVYITV
jgi:hypothetical protein